MIFHRGDGFWSHRPFKTHEKITYTFIHDQSSCYED